MWVESHSHQPCRYLLPATRPRLPTQTHGSTYLLCRLSSQHYAETQPGFQTPHLLHGLPGLCRLLRGLVRPPLLTSALAAPSAYTLPTAGDRALLAVTVSLLKLLSPGARSLENGPFWPTSSLVRARQKGTLCHEHHVCDSYPCFPPAVSNIGKACINTSVLKWRSCSLGPMEGNWRRILISFKLKKK